VSDQPAPQGVIAILTGPDGYVWATAADFAKFSPSGFSQKAAQEMRAKSTLAHEYIKISCHEMIAKVMLTHDCERIVEALRNQHGYKRTIKYIGYLEDEQ
jgi:hypothetical protein